MTNKIQKEIGKMLVLRKHKFVIENIIPFYTYEYDVLSVSKSNMLYEFEVKISKSDFNKPKEKVKQKYYCEVNSKGRSTLLSGLKILVPNYFSYCCPPFLIKPEEIPKTFGLYYVNEFGVNEIRKPKRLHSNSLDLQETIVKILRYYSERHFLGSCFMTYKNKQII